MFSLVRRFFSFLQRIADAQQRIAEAQQRIAAALERQSTSAVAAVPAEGLSKEDAARFIGVDVATIEQLIRTRKIVYVQHGSQRGRIVPVESLRQFLREYRQPTGKALLKNRLCG